MRSLNLSPYFSHRRYSLFSPPLTKWFAYHISYPKSKCVLTWEISDRGYIWLLLQGKICPKKETFTFPYFLPVIQWIFKTKVGQTIEVVNSVHQATISSSVGDASRWKEKWLPLPTFATTTNVMEGQSRKLPMSFWRKMSGKLWQPAVWHVKDVPKKSGTGSRAIKIDFFGESRFFSLFFVSFYSDLIHLLTYIWPLEKEIQLTALEGAVRPCFPQHTSRCVSSCCQSPLRWTSH